MFDLQAEGARFQREILDKAREETQKRMQEAQKDLGIQIDRLRQELGAHQGGLAQSLTGKFLSSPNTKLHAEHSHV